MLGKLQHENVNSMRIDWQQWLAIVALTALMLISAADFSWAANYRPLVDRLQRTDGGHVIEIQQVTTDGIMQAGYFKPRLINASRADASVLKEHIKVDLELRDTGYHDSTYTLFYDPAKDALLGL